MQCLFSAVTGKLLKYTHKHAAAT